MVSFLRLFFLLLLVGLLGGWIFCEIKKKNIVGLLLGIANALLCCVIVYFVTDVSNHAVTAYIKEFSAGAIRSVFELSQTENVPLVEQAVDEFSQGSGKGYLTDKEYFDRIVQLTTKLKEIREKSVQTNTVSLPEPSE